MAGFAEWSNNKKQQSGVQPIANALCEWNEIVLDCAGTEKRILRKACALIKPVVDMEGVESVDLSE